MPMGVCLHCAHKMSVFSPQGWFWSSSSHASSWNASKSHRNPRRQTVSVFAAAYMFKDWSPELPWNWNNWYVLEKPPLRKKRHFSLLIFTPFIFAFVFNPLSSFFVSSVLTLFTWRPTDRCSRCRSPRMLWWAQGFLVTPVRSTHWTMERWCAPLPSVTPPDTFTQEGRVASRSGTLVTQETRARCRSLTVWWVRWWGWWGGYSTICLFFEWERCVLY